MPNAFPQWVYSATGPPQLVQDLAGKAALLAAYSLVTPTTDPSTWLPANSVPLTDRPFVLTDGNALVIHRGKRI